MKAAGLKAYLAALVATIVFPLLWMRSLRLARRHSGKDRRAVQKVGVAIVLGVLILAGGAYKVLEFQDGAKAGMYRSAETRIAQAVGETTYQDNVATIETANGAIPKIQANLANATDPAKKAELEKALNDTLLAKSKAEAQVTAFTPNHDLFLRLQPLIDGQDDAGIRSAVSAANLAAPPGTVAGTNAALAIKDKAVSDMHLMLWLFVWPTLAGMFLAPLAFAVGSVLRKSFEESDSVGFKPYPSGAAGWFLLFGAFGVPSIPFAAWAFMDMESRSVEGQIAL